MRDLTRLILILTVIAAAAGLLLAVTNQVTADPIAKAARRESVEALKAVLPEFDNDPATCALTVQAAGRAWTFFAARRGGTFVGAAFEAASAKGYGGEIRLMIGVNADQSLRQVRVLAQQETPGLGAKIAQAPFISQFERRPVDGTTWAVRKDGGDFDAVTGATISSRAVLDAVRTGLEVYRAHAADITRTGVATP
jgi:electron transport complex protein RnfG